MLGQNRIMKATALYTIGNIFNSALSLFVMPIFTRLLSTTDYGIVNTYNSWVSIAALVVGLSLGNSLRSALTEYQNHETEYLSSIYSLSLISLMIALIVGIVVAGFLADRLYRMLIMLCIVQAFATFVINTLAIWYMMKMEYVKRTLLLALPNVIAISCSIVMILNMQENKYFGRIIPAVAVNSVLASLILCKSFSEGREFYNKKYWKYALSYSLPLLIHGFSVNILSQSDRTILTAMRSASETGLYSVAYNLSLAITVFTGALESVWIPWFTKKLDEGDKKAINTMAKLYIWAGVILAVCAMLCLPEVLKLFADNRYWTSIMLIPPVVLASLFVFLYTISVNLEYRYKATVAISLNTATAAVLNIILNVMFIPKYGMIAAAYTTVVAYVCSFVGHYLTARRLDNELFPINLYCMPILVAILGNRIYLFDNGAMDY